MNDSIQKLIDKYKTMIALKESEQKKTQEAAKNVKDSVDYGDEQKKKNIKLHLVRLGAEVRMIKAFINDIETLNLELIKDKVIKETNEADNKI